VRIEAKERGIMPEGQEIPVDELVEKTSDSKTEEGKKYLSFIREGIRRMLFFDVRYPFIKKVSGATAKIQLTAHMHVYDSLQGYWERNKNVYVHRAKSDYRALYIGTIHMLEEEQQFRGYDNSKEISKLQLFLEESDKRHKKYRDIALLRAEIKTCLTEQMAEDISQETFDKEMERLTNVYAEIIDDRKKAIKIISKLIQEEDTRAGNRIRQTKHRDYEKKIKGFSVVE